MFAPLYDTVEGWCYGGAMVISLLTTILSFQLRPPVGKKGAKSAYEPSGPSSRSLSLFP